MITFNQNSLEYNSFRYPPCRMYHRRNKMDTTGIACLCALSLIVLVGKCVLYASTIFNADVDQDFAQNLLRHASDSHFFGSIGLTREAFWFLLKLLSEREALPLQHDMKDSEKLLIFLYIARSDETFYSTSRVFSRPISAIDQ